MIDTAELYRCAHPDCQGSSVPASEIPHDCGRNSPTHSPGPWKRKSIPGHLFELSDAGGNPVLRIRGGMMPTLADATLLEGAPSLLTDNTALRDTVRELSAALEQLLSCADALIFRPSVDDSRQIDRDTLRLRAGLEPARAALSRAKGVQS